MDKIVDLAVMAILWRASSREEVLNESDISIIFGGIGAESDSLKTYLLDDALAKMPLEEMLDHVIDVNS